MWLRGTLLASLICLPGVVWAQQPGTITWDNVDPICNQAEQVPVPNALLPTATEKARLPKDCSALDLYYGTDAARFARARVCGLMGWSALQSAPKDQDRLDNTDLLALAMIFGNGEGVKRNAPLARRFACESGGFVETPAVLSAIDEGHLDVCSGYYGRRPNYLCILIDQDRATAGLQAEHARLQHTLPPQQLSAWKALDAARAQFIKAEEADEPSGTTGIVQTTMRWQADLDLDWLDDLKALDAGKPPADLVSAEDFSKVDKELNAKYKETLTVSAGCESGAHICMSPEEIRTAERAWLRYREAWVRMAAVRWPGIPADKVRAWLTFKRTDELQG
jgi:uncharacterized protein YecT (DUF1311 family)